MSFTILFEVDTIYGYSDFTGFSDCITEKIDLKLPVLSAPSVVKSSDFYRFCGIDLTTTKNSSLLCEYRVLTQVCEHRHSVKQCKTAAANPFARITPICIQRSLEPESTGSSVAPDAPTTSNLHKIYIGVPHNDNNNVNNSGCRSTQLWWDNITNQSHRRHNGVGSPDRYPKACRWRKPGIPNQTGGEVK